MTKTTDDSSRRLPGFPLAVLAATALAWGCDFLESTTDFSQGDENVSGIAFASMRSGNADIYLMDANGANVQQLTFSEVDERSPTWSPDGTLIAYSKRHELYDDDIFIMDIASGVETNVTNALGFDGFPRWSPDGTRIAFESRRDRNGNANVYVINADGTDLRPVTTHPAFDGQPSWSPDGSQILFESGREVFVHATQEIDASEVAAAEAAQLDPLNRKDPSFNHQIYLADVDGSGIRRLTFHSRNDLSPSFSPDGTRIIFVSDRDGGDISVSENPVGVRYSTSDIFLMNADGSGAQNLTRSPYYDHSPAWSADGSRIAFVSERNGQSGIYVMTADGSQVAALTTGASTDLTPQWMPGSFFSQRERCLLCPGRGGPQFGR